jgi:hypothetical protein
VLRLLGAVATSRDDWRETRQKRAHAQTQNENAATSLSLSLSLSSYLAIVSSLLVLSLLFASNDDDGSKL